MVQSNSMLLALRFLWVNGLSWAVLSLTLSMYFQPDFGLDWSHLKDGLAWTLEMALSHGWCSSGTIKQSTLHVVYPGNLDFSRHGTCHIILVKVVIRCWKINSVPQWGQDCFLEEHRRWEIFLWIASENTIFHNLKILGSRWIYQNLSDLYFIYHIY